MSQKDRIVREAAAMFLEEGVKSVRMDDIATRLGISKRTLYEMFSDKGELLEQSLKYHFAQKRSDMCRQALDAANVFEEIFIIMGATKRNEADTALVGNLKKFYPEIFHRLEEEAHRFSYSEFDRLLDRGIEQGLFPVDLNKDLALITIIYTIGALFEKRYHHFPQAGSVSMQPLPPPRVVFEYVIVNFFRGLATPKGIEVIDELAIKYRGKRERDENND